MQQQAMMCAVSAISFLVLGITMYNIVCYVFPYLQTFPLHRSEDSGSLYGPINLIPPYDWSSLNNPAVGIGLKGFTRVALFGFGG